MLGNTHDRTTRGPGPACPRCAQTLDRASDSGCAGCGLAFERDGHLLDVIAGATRERRAAEVEAFYGQAPFPGYAPGECGPDLVDRARRSPFLLALDAALPSDAELLEIGCGTAQLSAFLALSSSARRVLAVDGCRASLEHAEGFRARSGIDNLTLVRGDLFDLPVHEGRFRYAVCRGVVHHTPDPRAATAAVARCLAPGGLLVLGIYESAARRPHAWRRALGKVLGRRFIERTDPLLARGNLAPEKRPIWYADQYEHPLEQLLPLPRVLEWLEALGFDWLSSVPPAPSPAGLFEPSPRPGAAGLFLRRASWFARGFADPDNGLVMVLARKRSD